MTTRNDASTAKPAKPVQTKVGTVESDKRDKTRRVAVTFQAPHPKYGKTLRHRTILQVHDEQNESKVGDRVEIAPTRPISKTKSWRLVRVVERSRLVHTVIE